VSRVSDLTDFKDDPYLTVLRPLVEAYLAVWREGSRHVRRLHLTPSQFDVIVTLGDTGGMTCSDLSAATLVTKGTLTGVVDRLVEKGLIRRETIPGDRRAIRICLTERGETLFQKCFPAQAAFLRPFFQRALTERDAAELCRLLRQIRDSFDHSNAE